MSRDCFCLSRNTQQSWRCCCRSPVSWCPGTEMWQGSLLSCLWLQSNEPTGDHESVRLGRAEETRVFGTQMLAVLATPCMRGTEQQRVPLLQRLPPQHSSAPTHRACKGFSVRTAAGSRLQTTEQGREAEGAKAALASFKTTVFTVFHSILYDCTSGFLKDQPETSIAIEQPVTGGARATVSVSLITF